MIKNITLKLTLLGLIAGAAIVSQNIIAMKNNFAEYNQAELNKQLLKAAEDGDFAKAKKCLDNGANIETRNKYNDTPLILASFCGYTDIIKLLIGAGANIEAKDNYETTSLIYACINRNIENRNIEILKLLIHAGANIETQNQMGLTAFDYASQKGHEDITDYLTEVRKEISCFKNNPMKLTVDAPLIPKLPKKRVSHDAL